MTVALQPLARAGLIVSVAVLASRVLGWLRTVVIATTFGAGPDLDAYFAAFRIPDLIFQLVAAGALSSALVPVLASLFARDENAHAWRVVATVSNATMVVLLGLALLVELFAPVIVPLITPGFTADQIELTVRLTRLMVLSPLFLALGAVASSALNALGRFTAAAVAPLLYNLAIIAAALVLARPLGVEALAVGVVVGAVLSLLVQLPQLVGRRGFGFRLRVDLRDPAARQALLLMIPRAIGLGVTQITFLVNTSLATTIGVGALTAYNVAFTIMQIPIGIIGIPLGIVLLPSLSRSAALERSREFEQLVIRSLRLLLYILLPLTAVLMVLRVQIVTVLFDYGNFDQQAIDATSAALLLFLLGLAGHGLIVVLARAFYAMKDTRTPVAAAVLSVAVNVAVSLLTVRALGLAGLALGISAGAWFEAILLVALLARRAPAFDVGALGRAGATLTVGAAVAGLAAWSVLAGAEAVAPTANGKIFSLVVGLIGGAAGALAYLVYSRLLRVPEFPTTWSLLRSALRREQANGSPPDEGTAT